MKIEIKRLDLKAQKITEWGTFYLELDDRFLRYFAEFTASEPVNQDDEAMGWDEKRNYFNIVVSKSAITCIEVSWNDVAKKYMVIVCAMGIGSDLKAFFKTKVEAEEVREKLHKWLYD